MQITKRDYFAAAALTGLLARGAKREEPPAAPEKVSAEAFQYADAMMKLSKTLLEPLEFDPDEFGKEEPKDKTPFD